MKLNEGKNHEEKHDDDDHGLTIYTTENQRNKKTTDIQMLKLSVLL